MPQPAAPTRDLQFWKRFMQAYDPGRVLAADELGRLYQEPKDAPSASVRIRERVELAEHVTAVRVLLAGARGAGKTTELLRLLQVFSSEASPVVPIYVDVAYSLPEHATTRTWLPLVAAAVQAVREEWRCTDPTGGPNLIAAMQGVGVTPTTFRRVLGVVGSFAKALGPAGLPVAGAASLASEVTAAFGELSRETRQGATSGGPGAVESVVDALGREVLALERGAGRPVLLLLDGLDKRPSIEAVLEALDEAELLYRLSAALVLTAPMQVRLHARFAAQLVPGRFVPEELHNVPVVTRDGQDKAVGIQLLAELFSSRWEAAALGPPLFSEGQVRRLARLCSGVVREFLALVQQAGLAARRGGHEVASDADVEAGVRFRRQTFEATLTTPLWDLLERVYASGENPGDRVDELVYTNVVACYRNDRVWFRPNELLVDGILERLQRRDRRAPSPELP